MTWVLKPALRGDTEADEIKESAAKVSGWSIVGVLHHATLKAFIFNQTLSIINDQVLPTTKCFGC